MKYIKKIVNDIIDDYRTNDPFVLSKKMGIRLYYTDLGNIKGFFKVILGVKWIALNDEMSDFMTKLVLAHELGHAILHSENYSNIIEMRDNFLYSSSIIEKEANKFAAYLLINENLQDSDFYDTIESAYEEEIFRKLYSLSLE